MYKLSFDLKGADDQVVRYGGTFNDLREYINALQHFEAEMKENTEIIQLHLAKVIEDSSIIPLNK